MKLLKAKHTILMIALGFSLGYVGSFMQASHWREAYTVQVLATILKVAGILLLAYKVISYDGFRKFMER